MSPDLNDFKSINLACNSIGVSDIHYVIKSMEKDLDEKKNFRDATINVGAKMDWRNAKGRKGLGHLHSPTSDCDGKQE